jgi:pullulanase
MGSQVRLHFSDDAALAVTPDGLEGGESIELVPDGVVTGASAEKFRHLAGLPVFRIQVGGYSARALDPETAVRRRRAGCGRQIVDATSLQPAGVLDDLFTYEGELGVTFAGAVPSSACGRRRRGR